MGETVLKPLVACWTQGVEHAIERYHVRKFEARNPKFETIPKFKIQMTETGASTYVFHGF